VGIVNTFIGLFFMFFFLNVVGVSYWVSTFRGNTIGACILSSKILKQLKRFPEI
jgi:putative flippase GtrA